MFENMSYKNILNDMLSRVTSDVDKREGSIIFDAIAPCAYKLAETYFLLGNYIDLMFIDTAVGEYLDRACLSYGIERKAGIKAIRKITLEKEQNLDIGIRFALDDTSYSIIEKISPTEYKVECEQVGDIGNILSGKLDNIDNIDNTAILGDILLKGEELESDDDLRKRLFFKIQTPSSSGNVYDYKKWALEVAGVGNVKVVPLWAGNGTVKVIIVNSENEVDAELEKTVAAYIEEKRPIGASVTISSPEIKNLTIKSTVKIDKSTNIDIVKESLKETLNKYIEDITFKNEIFSYAKLGAFLLNVPGVLDYTELLLNDAMVSVNVSDDELLIINDITLSEVANE